jgi:uncharacterized protein
MNSRQTIQFNRANGHVVRFDGRAMLLHVPTTALFELDDLGVAIIDAAEHDGALAVEQLTARFGDRFGAAAIEDFINTLSDLDVLQGPAALRAINPKRVEIAHFPLSTLVLNVNTGCNLSCTYCYKEDLAVPARGAKMSRATAEKSIELLLAQGTEREQVNVVFFGGEPLTNLPLIRSTVEYAERRGQEMGKQVNFSLTTNGTLLNPELIDWFDAHVFGLSISIDGPKVVHDRHRRTVGGKGTYDLVAKNVRILLDRYRARPVGARVTLAAGTTAVESIHEHLRGVIGFHEIGYAPVTASNNAAHALSAQELTEVHSAFERLGEEYMRAALRGHNNGFSNMHQLMLDLHEGRRKALPCGAGVGLLAVDKSGGLNLCHRFTGSDMPTFGDLDSGIDADRLGAFITQAADRTGTGCDSCRIRNLCAGGCYHEAYARFGDPLHRTYHYCDLLRQWVDFGVRVYTTILSGNAQFFRAHIEPRRLSA